MHMVSISYFSFYESFIYFFIIVYFCSICDQPPENLGPSKEYNVDMIPKVCRLKPLILACNANISLVFGSTVD